MGLVGLFHELIRLGGRGGTNVFQNKHWGYLGVGGLIGSNVLYCIKV